VTVSGGTGFNLYNIEGTGVPTTINGALGTNAFLVSPGANLLSNILGALALFGGGADTVEFFDQNAPNSEIYTFDGVPSSLSLATLPEFSASFTGISAVGLETNGISIVNDPSLTVNVVVAEPAVGRAADGRLEVFVRGGGGHLWHLYQTAPNGDWSGWEDLSVYRPLGVAVVGEPAVGSAADGRLEVFVRGGDGHLWHLYQTTPNGDWSGWEDLSVYRLLGVTVVDEPAVGRAADGRLEVFVRGGGGHLWHLYQTAPNGDWSGWEDLSVYRLLGVAVVGEPAVGRAADGRLEVFVRGSDGRLWHLYQTTPNGDWSSWEDFGA
jgi:peptide methionine sulfoxide reductase MsrB